MTCCNLQEAPIQTMFLGCSVASFSASAQYGDGVSDLSVNLVADFCQGQKLFYTTCLTAVSGNYTDFGFFGEDLYQRSDSSLYSSCIKEDPSDTKLRDAVNLIGLPCYFRFGSFEYSGIISDWTRTNSNSAPSYRVKIVDPRLILQGVECIIGDYTGAVNGVVAVIDGGTGEPQTNLFNIYGYLEQFGLICPSYSQCAPGVYNTTATCPAATDGTVFGTLVGGFGGALLNENGIPYNYLITGFNFLANAMPAIQNYWSPYGRVSYFSSNITALGSSGCGLIEQDSGASYFANKNYYFVDLSELPAFPDNSYRISGTSINVLDLVSKASQDLNFDFYFELIPVKDPSNYYSSSCVAKIIKLRTILRTNQPSLDKICEFIQDSDCVLQSSIGQELRNETVSKFIIGGKKRSIYQIATLSNPDGGATNNITSLDSYIGGLRTASGCDEIDDSITPYFGLDYDGNFIAPCKVSGYWEFEAPVWSVQAELQELNFETPTVTINENEIRAALKGYTSWESYAAAHNTDTWQTIYESGVSPQIDIEPSKVVNTAGKAVLPHDVVNPKAGKFRTNIASVTTYKQEDKEAIYNWVRSYGEYYGRKFAVRVPFTCVKVDTDSLQPIISERPTNDGGWTEIDSVLDLPNGGPLSLGIYEYLNFFRDQENKIVPFVRFTDAVLLTVGGLSKEDYLYKYSILSGAPATGNGAPSGTPGSSLCYQDNLTDIIYVYYIDQWLPINQSPVLHGSGNPTMTGVQDNFIPVYYDTSDGDVYIAGDATITISGINIADWDITASLDLYVKAQVEEEYIYHDKRSYFAPRVVVEIPDSIRYVIPDAEYVAGITKNLAAVAGASTIADELKTRVGADASFTGLEFRAASIYSAAIPLEHQTLTYGPWYNPTITGRVEIVNESDLVPWRYNGYAGLNLAANQLANEARVNMYRGELGSITLPGYPTVPLGAELAAINDGYYSSSEHLIENRVPSSGSISGTDYNGSTIATSYGRFLFGSTWDGTYGPNVTDISIDVGADGFTTTYNMRTFAPRRGFFERYRAQRLEVMSVRANKILDLVRAEEKARARRLSFEGRGRGQTKRGAIKEANPVKQNNQSAQLLAGQEIVSGSGRRTAVANMPMSQGSYEVQNEYSSKAFMSLDGLLRPFSLDGDGGLSPFVFYTGTSGILQDDLNPFTNPSGYNRSRVSTVRNDVTNIGHDFEVLGRSGANETGLINAVGSGNTQYADDYRVMALRGPLVMKGWGYDISGYPVPNKVDTEQFAASGIYETTGLDPTKFLSGHLQKPHTWVTAPIDLRLDRDRGVWVAGNANNTPSTTEDTEIMLISVTGDRDDCCLYTGFMRPLSINLTDPCQSTLDYEEVYIYHHCDILTPPDCILGKFKGTMGADGCHPSGKIYQFMSIAMPDTTPTPCDCCCPINDPEKVLRGKILSSTNCSVKTFEMTYATGLNNLYFDCSGNTITELGSPYDGWVSEDITCSVEYPVVLRSVTLTVDGVSDPGYYFRTDYSTPTPVHTSTYYDDNGDLFLLTSGWTFDADNGTDRILTDSNNDIIFDTLTLKYKLFVKCPEETDDVVDAVIVFIPPTSESGINPDAQTLSAVGGCAFNIANLTSDSIFGQSDTCGITVDVSGGGGATYDLNPWKLHWYCMCQCSGGGYPIDKTDATFDIGICTPPDIRVRIEWD